MTIAFIFLLGMVYGAFAFATAIAFLRDVRLLRLRTAEYRDESRRMARAMAGSVRTPVPAGVVRIDRARELRTKGVC